MKFRHIALTVLLISSVHACVNAPAPEPSPVVKRTWSWTPPARPQGASDYANFLVGRFASLTNDPREAARRYADAIQSAPGDPGLTERAIFAALLSGDMDTAVRISEGASPEVFGQAALPRLTVAVDQFEQGNYRATADILGTGEYGLFNDLIAQNLRYWAVFESKSPSAAIKAAKGEERSDDLSRNLGLFTLGLLQIADERYDAAEATYQSMWDSGSRFALAAEYLAQLKARSGDSEGAAALLVTYETEVGLNAAHAALADRIASGEKISPPRLTPAEGAALAIYAPASALAAQTSGDVAGVYFSLALTLDPDLDIARTLWADALEDAGRGADAIEVLKAVPPSSPYYAGARGQLAWALRREERNDEALIVATQAFAAKPDRDLQIQLGDLFRSLERYGEAERVFDGLIKDDEATSDWRLIFARGAAREQMGRWPEAEADLKAALELQPNNPSVLNYLGYSWVDRGLNMDQAFDYIRKAVSLRPTSGLIVDSLGWAHYKRGEYDTAVRYLERAVELEPGDPVLNDHLGDAYWKVGRRLEAGFQWNRALTLEPEDAEAIKSKLENGLEATTRKVAEYASGPIKREP